MDLNISSTFRLMSLDFQGIKIKLKTKKNQKVIIK